MPAKHHLLGAVIAAQLHRCTEQAKDLVLAAVEVGPGRVKPAGVP
jgi:hypothetical protein